MSKKRADGLIQRQVTIRGKRKVFYGRTDREINRKIAAYTEGIERGRLFSEIADEWENEHFPTLSPTTLKGYGPALKRAVEEFGDLPAKQITPKHISLFLQRFAARGYALKTVKTQLLVINLTMQHAVLSGDCDYNPAAAVPIPKGLKKTRRELPTVDEIQKVKDSVDCTFGLFAFFILYTGCRRGEALALTYEDIDRENMVVHVTKSVYYSSNDPKIKSTKTEAGCRDIILLDVLADKLPKSRNKKRPLFANEQGEYYHHSHFQRMWKKYLAETGMQITPHQLRHAYATILYEAGIKDKDAQDLLGHANIQTTRDIYTHITNNRRAETAALLNAATKR
ncbi:MAG: site-specific integrase [Clostridia bacterium]|nr:site-specific integrase [Clostridia bacterium]